MQKKSKYVTAVIVTVASGFVGAMTIKPSTIKIVEMDRNPGYGLYRTCDNNDEVCHHLRNQELYTGQSFSKRYRTETESNKTFQDQLTRGFLAAGVVGIISFGLITFTSRTSWSDREQP